MGLFDFFRRKQESKGERTPLENPTLSPIYQDSLSDDDDKFPAVINPGRFGENHIITFEARKRTAIPSEAYTPPRYCSCIIAQKVTSPTLEPVIRVSGGTNTVSMMLTQS